MPTYVYRCETCMETFEFIQTMAEKPLRRVPSTSGPCGEKCKAAVTKLLTPPNVNLRQGQTERIRTADGHVEKHWDGRQDATVQPDVVRNRAGVHR